MKPETQEQFDLMCEGIRDTYGVQKLSNYYVADPTQEQKLNDLIVDDVGFLSQINVLPVDDLAGQKIYGSTSRIVPKRTNTRVSQRQTVGTLNLDTNGYELFKTEYDVHIEYAQIDQWAKFPDLYNRWMRYVRGGVAEARIMTGFYGIASAEETDIETYPNGEDVNKGWLQILREYNGGSQMLSAGRNVDEIRIGNDASADYVNLDSVVHDLKQGIPKRFRKRGLVAIIGEELLSKDSAQLYEAQGSTPSEKERIENQKVNRTYGGLPSLSLPQFPDRGIFVTPLNNLSIYYQSKAVRQKMIDEPKADRIEHYHSMNEGYVLEEEEASASLEFDNVRVWNSLINDYE